MHCYVACNAGNHALATLTVTGADTLVFIGYTSRCFATTAAVEQFVNGRHHFGAFFQESSSRRRRTAPRRRFRTTLSDRARGVRGRPRPGRVRHLVRITMTSTMTSPPRTTLLNPPTGTRSGNDGSSSARHRRTSWNAASGSNGTFQPPRGSTWRASSD